MAPTTAPDGTDTTRRPEPFAWLPGGIFMVTGLLVAALFTAWPEPLPEKAHLALHGLCAQIPAHTLIIGGQPLPLDSRMTGIYGGVAVAAGWLIARRRLASSALPGWPIVALLVLFVGAMGLDGTNSLLRDLALPHPYTPHNWLRVLTGTATGISIAVALVWLFADTAWTWPEWQRSAVRSWREMGELGLLGAAWMALVLLAPGWLYAPIVAVLLGSAVLVVTVIAFVAVSLGRGRARWARTFDDLRRPATVALLIGLVAMATIGVGRLCFESAVGLPAFAH